MHHVAGEHEIELEVTQKNITVHSDDWAEEYGVSEEEALI